MNIPKKQCQLQAGKYKISFNLSITKMKMH